MTPTCYQALMPPGGPPASTELRVPVLKESDMSHTELKDHGPKPYAVNIEDATVQNTNFRTALWTGKHLQMTLMSIPVGGEIGLEKHDELRSEERRVGKEGRTWR